MKNRFSVACLALASIGGATGLFAQADEGATRARIVEMAESFKGVPYVYGAESPQAFDCSGLVQYVYAKAADLRIPRNSKGIWEEGRRVELAEAKTGDIIVFDTVHSGGPSHVAIFKSGGSIIHAVSEGRQTGVIVSALKGSSFERDLLGARCFIVSLFPAPKKGEPASPSAPKPVAPKGAVKPEAAEVPLSQIGVLIKEPHDVVEDPIPALAGTAIAFTITNATGSDGVFHIAFYKTGAKYVILREERLMLRAGASKELVPYTFSEPGVYRLNVKSADNTQMMQRAWKVIERSR